MTIYNYIPESAQRSGTGVARFAQMLKRAISEIVEISEIPVLSADDVVICDNHRSLDVPDGNKAVVVAHGNAETHFERDEHWRHVSNLMLVRSQKLMIAKQNRIWVYPSLWVADEFSRHNPDWFREVNIIPHWVDSIPSLPKPARPLIIGDWRDANKGASAWKKLAAMNPQWDFKPLSFKTDADKREQYGRASLYLCLSLSEGGSYSMCDAEAARLPIVCTDTGNYLEFADCEVIRWQDRDNLELVSAAIERKLATGRKTCFYDSYSFEDWQGLWLNVIQ